MPFFDQHETIFKDLDTLLAWLRHNKSLQNAVLQAIDLRSSGINWQQLNIDRTAFLGCFLSEEDERFLIGQGAYFYPAHPNLPYQPFRKGLYTWQELMDGYDPVNDQSTDLKIYTHFVQSRFNPPLLEALSQRIHDHSIDDALRELIEVDDQGNTVKKCVGIMGGHSTSRLDPFYRKTVETSYLLAKAGYLVVSGGGPGIMEAANLGAYLSVYPSTIIDEALDILQVAPSYKDPGYIESARRLIEMYPAGASSLAIPTWFYGHEPSNLFASHIAKYFSNSIREDTLLAISLHGIVFAPGSAGTTQEIFMDATQNHYGTFQYYSPMVFLGNKRYEIDTLIFPLLKQLSWEKDYHQLLHLTNHPSEVLRFLQEHPPIRKK
ncbi:MAG: hypothetical protein AAF598_08625 [Bacteroidota bacterium]